MNKRSEDGSPLSTIFSNLDYTRPIKIADNIYWVGQANEERDLFCNPYLLIDEGMCILIDGGSRPDFSTVMRKILQVGVNPNEITHLIYQHYDPDLCGSLSNLEDIIAREDLKILSTAKNNTYIRFYSDRTEKLGIKEMDYELILPSGRKLTFIPTPFVHAAGAFMTYDEQTGTLFTSDLFGSYNSKIYNDREWGLFLEIDKKCKLCDPYFPHVLDANPEVGRIRCEWAGISRFHQQNMPSKAALRHALDKVKEIQPAMIAPQHGSILYKEEDIELVIERLYDLDVGIDGILTGSKLNA